MQRISSPLSSSPSSPSPQYIHKLPSQPLNIHQSIPYDAQVALISAALGIVFTSGIFFSFAYNNYPQLPFYISTLTIFHFLEFYVTARYNSSVVSIDSFLFNNGLSYIMAHATAIIEAVIEIIYFPWLKQYPLISLIGLAIAGIGQFARSFAMIKAASNFNHVIQSHKQPEHTLVTTGIYSFSRHPSYFGFFYWDIGLQVFLLNPVSILLHIIVLWKFFHDRIIHEEIHLTKFFGQKYIDYKKRTTTKIPFIN